MKADDCLQIILGHVLPAALSQELEGQDLVVDRVISNELCVEDEVLHAVSQSLDVLL